MVDFNLVPSTSRVPGIYVEFDSSRAVTGVQPLRLRTLLIGQKLSTGTVAELVAKGITSVGQAINYFGRGSMLTAMVAAFLQNNRETELVAIALNDAGGSVKASGTITFTGSATEAGVLHLYVAGKHLQVPITIAQSVTSMAAATAVVINADLDLPVTATSALGVVTVLSRNAGVVGNEIDVRVNYGDADRTPAGVTVVIVEPTGGTGDVVLANVWPVLGEQQYHVMVVPVVDATNLTSLENELEDRWGPTRQNDGAAITAKGGSESTVATFGLTRNSKQLTVMENVLTPDTPYERASRAGALIARYGTQDPGRPFQTLKMVGSYAPAIADQLTVPEAEDLLHKGVSTTYVGADGSVFLQRILTTYRLNEFGAEDEAFLDLNTKLILSRLRVDVRSLFATRYPRHKLGKDGITYDADQAIITPNVAKAELIGLFRQWEREGLVEGIEQFKADLVVEIDASNHNRLNILLPPDLINQLITVAARVQFRL